MIITCPCNKKKFKIEANLIPATGRELKCGSCGHVWFYINESKDEISNKIEIPKKLETQNIKAEDKNLNLSPELEDALNKNKDDAILKKDKTIIGLVENRKNFQKNINKKKQQNKKKEKPISFINKIIISLITLIAIIILIDTFRNEIINFLPGLNPAFNSFYAIIADINSFIKDLIR